MLQLSRTTFTDCPCDDKSEAQFSSTTPEKLREEGALCGRPRALERKEAGVAVSKPQTEIQKFENKQGVCVETKDGKYRYLLKIQGEDRELFTTEADSKGLEKAEAELAKLRREKTAELAKTFKVSFSLDGEDVLRQWVQKDDCSWQRGNMIKARSPNLAELSGIEAALYKAQPSQLTQDGSQGVKFYFLTDHYYKHDVALAYHIQQDKNNKQSVYFEPGANEGKPITEKDADRMGDHHLYSIEAVTHHELMHNAQQNLNWNVPSQKEKWARKVGWLPFEDPKTHETKWIFTGKKDELYRRDQDHCKDDFKWCACGKHGELQDDNGKSVSRIKDAKHFSLDQIRDLAEVKPSTRYFVNPLEMFAEGGMKYRINEKRREELYKDSPRLYDAVKEHDQQELDLRYGKDSSGASKYIRSASGIIVLNTADARAEIQKFEDRIRKEEKKK
ncbi:MAG TPA: hypothetical protein PKZ32_10870 [Candidatus Melainabacteria bacterium]|nr:hypothetical protein [Candidatus Melainabacteria bacterium]